MSPTEREWLAHPRAPLVLAIAIGVLLALCDALPRATRPGTLTVRETELDRYDVVFAAPRHGRRGAAVAPAFPEACTVARGTGSRRTLDCADGLYGRAIGVYGLEDTSSEVILSVQHLDGVAELHVLRAGASRAVLGAPTSAFDRHVAMARLGLAQTLRDRRALVLLLGLLLVAQNAWTAIATLGPFAVAQGITLGLTAFQQVRAPWIPLVPGVPLVLFALGLRGARDRETPERSWRWLWLVGLALGAAYGASPLASLTWIDVPAEHVTISARGFLLGVLAAELAFAALAILFARALRVLEVPEWITRPRWIGVAIAAFGVAWTIESMIAILLSN